MDEQERNRRLAANIAAGRSPLDSEMIETMRTTAAANLDVPGPRVLQLLAEVARLRARLAEHERLQTLGGPPPAVDTSWANVALPEVPSASDPSAPELRRSR